MDFRAAATINNSAPENIDDNERRRQERLFIIFNREIVSIETPHLFALLFHFLIYIATITGHKIELPNCIHRLAATYLKFYADKFNMTALMSTPPTFQGLHETINDRSRFVGNMRLCKVCVYRPTQCTYRSD